jgi:DNA-binding NtrC family response regulator
MAERILIVEDERITAEHLHDVLTDFGYEVTGLASSSEEAIANAAETHPDLALMDIRIKGEIDGTETARILRERFDIPVVYLTAHADRETLGRAKQSEPLGYLVKPFQESELQASIEIAMHKHRADRASRTRRELLTSALEALGQGVISVDRNGAVTLLNPAAEAWTGWTQQEAVGRSVEQVFELIDEGSAEPVTASVKAILHGSNTGIQELGPGLLLVPKMRGGRSVAGTVAPILDPDGNSVGAVIVFGVGTGGGGGSGPAAALGTEADSVDFGRFRMIAASPAMKKVVRFARRVADSEATTILIEGESGTGKDVMAQFMHHVGKRQSGPFVALNCAAIPETLLESELFGFEKGAFTDARNQKRGLLEAAHGGTIFLDEIGEMPLVLQAKMLRVLESQLFRRLGGLHDIQVDVRVVAATNRLLSSAVKAGTFRLDLFYRLNVIQVTLPALRDRREDILPMAQHFVGFYNDKFKREIRGLSNSAVKHLYEYEWPGNVRELRNTIERAILLEESDWIQADSLQMQSGEDREEPAAPITPLATAQAASGDLTLKNAELSLIQQALKQASGNQTKAAAILGVTRDVLRYRMKKFNIITD